MALPGGLKDFEGHWRIARRIEDRVGPDARFTGTAVFSPDGAGLLYTETGQLQMAEQSFAATRTYMWHPDGRQIAVYFDDGRLFHRFEPGVRAQAGHDCAPDRYDVTYTFGAWPLWQAVWEVRGPRKNYRMVSDYAPE